MAGKNRRKSMSRSKPLFETPNRLGEATPTVSPNTHFPPSNGPPNQCHVGHHDLTDYGYLLKKIAQNQTTTDCPPLPFTPLQKFRSLPLHEQIANFERCQQLSNRELQRQRKEANEVLSFLRNQSEFKGYTAASYGPILTGIFTNDSDHIRISIDLDSDNNKNTNSVSEAGQQISISDLRTCLAEKLRKASSPDNPAQQIYRFARIIGARRPFIRFLAAETNISVNMFFGNRISVRNSQFIGFYLKLEPMTRRLLGFFQYWAKFYAIAVTNSFTENALSMIALVFLMEKGILPSVLLLKAIDSIQRMNKGLDGTMDLQSEWDFSYDIRVIRKYFRPVSVSTVHSSNSPQDDTKIFFDLLTEFFERLSTIDFLNSMVSPLLGKILPKDEFGMALVECINTLSIVDCDSWIKWRKTYLSSTTNSPACGGDLFSRYFNHNDTWVYTKTLELAKQTLSVLRSNPSTFLELFECPAEVHHEQTADVIPLPVEADHVTVPVDIDFKQEVSFPVEEENLWKYRAAYEIHNAICGDQQLAWHRSFQNGDPLHAVKFNMSYSFFKAYLSVLYRCRMLAGPSGHIFTTVELKWQMTSLWAELGKQFWTSFCNSGLFLKEKNENSKEIYVNCAIKDEDRWSDGNDFMEDLIFNLMKNGLTRSTNQAHVQAIRRKIDGLIIPASVLYYEVAKLKVTYPFWERPKLNYTIAKCPLEEERMISSEIMKYSKESNDQKPGTSAAAKKTATFTPFFLKVLVKLDARADQTHGVCGIPAISFIVQESWDETLPAEIRRSENHIKAMMFLVDMLERTFEVYQSRRLSEWLEIEKL